MSGERDQKDVHRHIDWMVPADVAILEYLDSARDRRGNPSVQTPNTIALNTGYGNRHASARCGELADRGLIERVDKGQYRLAELGKRAIAQEISIEELREVTGR